MLLPVKNGPRPTGSCIFYSTTCFVHGFLARVSNQSDEFTDVYYDRTDNAHSKGIVKA